jgi:hypothetical protein
LRPSSNLDPFPGYSTVRRDRPGVRGGGGLLLLIRHSTPYRTHSTDHLFPGDQIIEHQGITIEPYGTPLHITNLYIPPSSSCPNNYTPDLSTLFSLDVDQTILGDLNAHHDAWYSRTADGGAARRGNSVDADINNSPLALLNEDTHTRAPSNGPLSSPDITVISAHLAMDAHWTTPAKALSSDHLPIIITLRNPALPPNIGAKRIFLNLRRANWDDFLAETEGALYGLPHPTSARESLDSSSSTRPSITSPPAFERILSLICRRRLAALSGTVTPLGDGTQ